MTVVFAIGCVVFALGITLSVALHECGHMWAAKSVGMKVRRYYIGFGPKIFSFQRGETEYGLKAIPLGGFCDIAGMTAIDELSDDEVERAMYKQKTWKRLYVMSAGIAVNVLLGYLVFVAMAMSFGLPNLNEPPATALGEMTCVATLQPDGKTLAPCTGLGPAQQAGLKRGDVVTAVNGVPVNTWDTFVDETRKQTAPYQYTVRRDGQTLTVAVTPSPVARPVKQPDGSIKTETVNTIGAGRDYYEPITYGPLAAFPAAATFTGHMMVETGKALTQLPSKVGKLVEAVGGGERDQNTPISVLGATRLGGEAAEHRLWPLFITMLATLNFFLAAFNLVPLLPLDGGHMAIAAYERVRNAVRRRRGLPDGQPVDYLRLMPATYVVIVVGGLYMLLTLTADIVNPIKLF